jgi:hypothetical protein
MKWAECAARIEREIRTKYSWKPQEEKSVWKTGLKSEDAHEDKF